MDELSGEIVIVTDPTKEEWYLALVEECKAIITEAVFNSRWALVEGYHQLGERIVMDENYQKAAKGNLSSWQGLAKNIGISDRTIRYAIQFYEKYPRLDTVPEGKNITWNKIITKYLPSGNDPDTVIRMRKITELLERWRVKPGQLWALGNHRLMCGDTYNLADMKRLVKSDTVNAMITDPPYGIGYKPDWNKWDGSPSDFSPITGDEGEFDPSLFLNFPIVVLFGANYFSRHLPIGGWICWDKRLDENKDSMFGSPFELAWYRSVNTTEKAIMIRVLHGGVVNADSKNGNNEKRLHPTQKPVSVMRKIIEIMTLPGDVVLDPFSGSGSTLLACLKSDSKSIIPEHKCLAMEIEPGYVAVTLQRWLDKTGKRPVLIGE